MQSWSVIVAATVLLCAQLLSALPAIEPWIANSESQMTLRRAESTKPMCIGHRGASYKYPENTILSLEMAMLDGAEGVELDVHMTRDGVVVLLHDDTLDRTTNGSGHVWDRDYTGYVEFLKTKGGHESVPRFNQVLEWLRHHPSAQVLVDIKDTNPLEIVDAMMVEIMQHSRARMHDFRTQIIFGVWQVPYLDRARIVAPGFRVTHISRSISKSTREFYDRVDSYNVKFDLLKFDRSGFLSLIRGSAETREIYGWTINSKRDMRKAILMGLDAILSDDPGQCRKIVDDDVTTFSDDDATVSEDGFTADGNSIMF